MLEPFIENYEKFTSNTGWYEDVTPWKTVMQALSHFSYHATEGEYVLCDLQGGIYPECVVLFDPAVMSRLASVVSQNSALPVSARSLPTPMQRVLQIYLGPRGVLTQHSPGK